MKARQFWLTVLLVLAVLMLVGPSEAAYKLVENGASNWHIMISSQAIPSERYAAKELQVFLKEISGADLIIIEYDVLDAYPLTDKKGGLNTNQPEIIIGNNKRLEKLLEHFKIKIDFDKLGEEGFIIKTIGPHLVIAGGRPRGTLYGVYTFLEDYLGCRWFDSTVSVIPKRSTIVLDTINDKQVPQMKFRDVWFGMFKDDADLAVRNKINGVKSPLTEIHGGKFPYAYPRYHTFEWLLPASKYFKEHPEYYSLIGGQRKARQPCLTNPEVLKIVTERVKKWMRDNPDQKVFDVSQNDGGGYCQCPDCNALDEKEGSRQGTLLTFVNNVADAIKGEFPDRYISTFAYHYSDNPPKTIRPRDNVIVFLCTFCSAPFLYDYEEHGFSCRCEPGVPGGLGRAVKKWSELMNNLFIWDYPADYRNLLRPFPNFKMLKTNMQFFAKVGVKGYFAQNTGHGLPGGLVPLQAYLI